MNENGGRLKENARNRYFNDIKCRCGQYKDVGLKVSTGLFRPIFFVCGNIKLVIIERENLKET